MAANDPKRWKSLCLFSLTIQIQTSLLLHECSVESSLRDLCSSSEKTPFTITMSPNLEASSATVASSPSLPTPDRSSRPTGIARNIVLQKHLPRLSLGCSSLNVFCGMGWNNNQQSHSAKRSWKFDWREGLQLYRRLSSTFPFQCPISIFEFCDFLVTFVSVSRKEASEEGALN